MARRILDLVKTVEQIRPSTPLLGNTKEINQWEDPISDMRGMVGIEPSKKN